MVFSLERDSRFSIPVLPAPKTTKVRLQNETVVLETDLELDYWEMDPNWDGLIFKSVAQAVRPIRNGRLPCELKVEAGSNLCVRLVTSQGEFFQLNV